MEISKKVVQVERWQGRIMAAWMMIRQQMPCVICVYGPQTGRTEAEKEVFREEVDKLALRAISMHIRVVEPGDKESIGRFGWGTMNREGRELVEMLRSNGWRSRARSSRIRRTTQSPRGADGTRQSSTYWWCGISSSGG